MFWAKFSGIARVVMAAALIAAPATVLPAAPSYADCGDPGQDPCTGPVPSPDEVVAIMAELTDPNRPAASKTDIVTPGFTPEEAGTIDDHLNSLNSRGYLPYDFVVTDIQPAPDNFAGATVAGPKNFPYSSTPPQSIVLINQDGRWLVTNDTAMAYLNKMWSSTRHRYVPPGAL